MACGCATIPRTTREQGCAPSARPLALSLLQPTVSSLSPSRCTALSSCPSPTRHCRPPGPMRGTPPRLSSFSLLSGPPLLCTIARGRRGSLLVFVSRTVNNLFARLPVCLPVSVSASVRLLAPSTSLPRARDGRRRRPRQCQELDRTVVKACGMPKVDKDTIHVNETDQRKTKQADEGNGWEVWRQKSHVYSTACQTAIILA